jgi:hypothetical protein
MSIGFFIVGGVIFLSYVYLMIWNIFTSNKKQREENYSNHPDMIDMDGHGNWGRFIPEKQNKKVNL